MLNPVFSTNMPETGNTPIMRAQPYFGLVCGFKGTEVDTGDHRAMGFDNRGLVGRIKTVRYKSQLAFDPESMGAGDSSAKQAAVKNNNEVSND